MCFRLNVYLCTMYICLKGISAILSAMRVHICGRHSKSQGSWKKHGFPAKPQRMSRERLTIVHQLVLRLALPSWRAPQKRTFFNGGDREIEWRLSIQALNLAMYNSAGLSSPLRHMSHRTQCTHVSAHDDAHMWTHVSAHHIVENLRYSTRRADCRIRTSSTHAV